MGKQDETDEQWLKRFKEGLERDDEKAKKDEADFVDWMKKRL